MLRLKSIASKKFGCLPLFFSVIAFSLHAEDPFELEAEEDAFIAEQSSMKHSDHRVTSTSLSPTARPLCEGCWGIVLSGDYLHWKAAESGLSYALNAKNITQGSTNFRAAEGVRGNPSKIHPGYHSGYRLGLDIELPRDEWDLQATWTRYQSHDDESVKANGKLLWIYYLNPNQGLFVCDSAKANWELNFNVLDTVLGHSFFVAKYLSLRPSFGFRSSWIEQELNIHYINVSDFTTNYGTFRSRNQNNFVGYGMVAGLQSLWPLKWGFNLFGNVAASLLWSRFKLNQFERNPDHTPRTHLSDRLYLTTPTIEMMGGLKWLWHFNKNRVYLDIHAGWEEQVWFKQNQLNLFLNHTVIQGNAIGKARNQQQNLTLSGWTIGAQLGF